MTIIARTLGPSGKGAFSLVVLILSIVHSIFHGSLGPANAYYSGRQSNRGASIVGNSFAIAIFWGGILVLLFRALADQIFLRFFPEEYVFPHFSLTDGMFPNFYLLNKIYPQFIYINKIQPLVNISFIKITAIALPALMLFDYSNNIVMGQDRIRRFSFLLVFRELLFLISLILLLVLGLVTVKEAMTFWIIALMIASVYSGWSAWSGVGFRIKIDPRMWLTMLRYSLQVHVANLTSFLKSHADKLILAYFLSLAEFGYYSLATMIVMLLWYLPSATSQVLLPYISRRDNTAGDEMTPRMCRIIFFITILVALLMSVFGRIGIKLIFGSEFLPAYPVLLVLLPGAVIYSLATVLSGDLSGRGKPYYAMWISAIVLVLNIGIAIVLIPVFGIIGAAIAAAITHSISGVLFLLVFNRESKVSVWQTLVIQKEDIYLLKKL